MKNYFIYKITNTINGKVYIGETCTSIELRFKRHYGQGSNCTKLKRAFNKYGVDKFEVSEIDHAHSQAEAFEKETFWIKYYDSVNNGYNVLYTNKEPANKKPKKVFCCETKEVFESVSACARFFQTTCGVIGSCCNGRKATAKGKHFCFINEKGNPDLSKIKNVGPLLCRVKCVETGEIFNSINEASKYFGINKSSISNCLNGKAPRAGKLHWIRLDKKRVNKRSIK